MLPRMVGLQATATDPPLPTPGLTRQTGCATNCEVVACVGSILQKERVGSLLLQHPVVVAMLYVQGAGSVEPGQCVVLGLYNVIMFCRHQPTSRLATVPPRLLLLSPVSSSGRVSILLTSLQCGY